MVEPEARGGDVYTYCTTGRDRGQDEVKGSRPLFELKTVVKAVFWDGQGGQDRYLAVKMPNRSIFFLYPLQARSNSTTVYKTQEETH